MRLDQVLQVEFYISLTPDKFTRIGFPVTIRSNTSTVRFFLVLFENAFGW
jgi:hypothetical protein